MSQRDESESQSGIDVFKRYHRHFQPQTVYDTKLSQTITDGFYVNYHIRFLLKTVCDNYVSQTVLAIDNNINSRACKTVSDNYNIAIF